MPELPEIETLARQFRDRLQGTSFSGVQVLRASMVRPSGAPLQESICGRRVQDIARTGKFFAMTFEGGHRLWFHLGMSGQVVVSAGRPRGISHIHLLLELSDGKGVLYYRDPRRFGKVLFQPAGGPLPVSLRRVAPDPFQMSAAEFADRYRGRKARIKSLLLDQHLVSGLGNIYADESLFRAGIDPRKRANRLKRERLEGLHGRVCELLKEALTLGGSTIGDYRHLDGKHGGFQEMHRVYGRERQACPGCGAPVRRVVISGRSSYFCPVCQKD